MTAAQIAFRTQKHSQEICISELSIYEIIGDQGQGGMAVSLYIPERGFTIARIDRPTDPEGCQKLDLLMKCMKLIKTAEGEVMLQSFIESAK